MLLPRRLVAGGLIAAAALGAARADVVTDWNRTLESALRNPTPSIPVQARVAAAMHTAVFDAVNGITRRYAPLYVKSPPPPGARPEAAAAQAARDVLVGLFPGRQAAFDAQLAASLAEIPGDAGSSAAIAAGRAWGETVAREILAWRAADGFSTPMTYPGNTGVGHWRHPPLGNAPAGALSMGAMVPFALTQLAAFDPGPPYGTADRAAALASAAYAADVNEVKARGGTVSSVRTPQQTDLAWLIHIADVPDLNTVVRQALPAGMRLEDRARIFALLNVAAADAGIVCFRAKYQYGFWRPLQAIPYADLDGNPATVADPAWQPLGPTPSHPEYVSGHSTLIGAMVAMAAGLLGDETAFTLTTSNPGAPAIAPRFARFSALLDAIVEARIDLGFHFRTSCVVGRKMAQAVADQLLRTTAQPLRGNGLINLAVRGRIGAGDDMLIAGFQVADGARHALIRAVGPALGTLGVGGALADPRVMVYDRTGRLVAENDDWSAGGPVDTAAMVAAMARAGAFPLPAGSRDAAVLTLLPPGTYTIHATGPAGAAGVALIEVYEVP